MKKLTVWLIIEHIIFFTVIVGISIHTNTVKSQLFTAEKSVERLSRQIVSLKKHKKELKLLKYFFKIEKATEVIRGLYARHPIEYNTIAKDELNEFLHKKFTQTYPDEVFHDIEQSLKIIGLIDDSVNLKNVMLSLYREQIAAFYDYHDQKLYYVESSFFTPNNKRMFISHEIVHALQDQHFDLLKMGLDNRSNDDSVFALSALFEGDAMYCMNEYYKSTINAGLILDLVSGLFALYKQEQFQNAPPYIKETMLFPYLHGLTFASLFYEENTVVSIDDVFRHPPQSTEQIMHPEKYIARETPHYPLFPDLSHSFEQQNLRILTTNVLGELTIGLLFKQHLPSHSALNAAEGWGSDQYITFEDNTSNQTGFIVVSLWDSQKDAEEFFNAYLTWAKEKYSLEDTPDSSESNVLDVLISDTKNSDAKKRLTVRLSQSACTIIYAPDQHCSFLQNMVDSAALLLSLE